MFELSYYKFDTWVARTTDIDRENLFGYPPLGLLAFSCRLSWAAKSKAKRIDDLACCLMGILVNIPLLYGEGDRASPRLQDAATNKLDDMLGLPWRNMVSTRQGARYFTGWFCTLAYRQRYTRQTRAACTYDGN